MSGHAKGGNDNLTVVDWRQTLPHAISGEVLIKDASNRDLQSEDVPVFWGALRLLKQLALPSAAPELTLLGATL